MNQFWTGRLAQWATSRFRLLSKALAAVVLVGGSSATLAAMNGVSVNVNLLITPDPSAVQSLTYSTTGVTSYAAYGVTIANTSNANVQNAWLKFSTSTDTSGLNAPFDGTQLPAKCAIDPYASPANTGIVCNFSQADLVPGSTFTLLVPTPAAPPSNAQALLSLSWTLQAGQGNAPVNNSQVVQQGSAQPLVLKVGSATDVRTWVPGGKSVIVIDNGNGGTSSNVGPPKSVTVGLKQDVNPQSCINGVKCFTTTVSILGGDGQPVTFDPPLAIDLFRPCSTLAHSDPDECNEYPNGEPEGDEPNIKNAVLFYTGADNNTYPIPWCQNGQVPTAPPFRCITPVVTGVATRGQTGVDAAGNWLFHIIGSTNGIMNW